MPLQYTADTGPVSEISDFQLKKVGMGG